jgi:hypothetical protein
VRVELHGWDGLKGVVLLERGCAVFSNDCTRRLLEDMKVVEPGTDPRPVRPEDGERYLRALPANFHGAYLWAVLIEDD